MTSLARPAKGLPRYFMDCGWHRHIRFAGLDPAVLFVFDATVGYCTEHGTEGYAPSNPEDLALAIGVKASYVKKALPLLIERDALLDKADRVYVRGWSDHNPTNAEVEDRAKERSVSGTRGNHIRWHVNKGVVDPGCPFCMEGEGDDPDPFASL